VLRTFGGRRVRGPASVFSRWVPEPFRQPRGGPPLVVAPPQEGGDLLLEADLEHVLRRPGDELAEGVAQRGSLELGGQGFPHPGARWYPLHGVGAPFSVPWDGPVRHRKGTLRLSIFTPKIGHHPIEPFNLGKSLW